MSLQVLHFVIEIEKLTCPAQSTGRTLRSTKNRPPSAHSSVQRRPSGPAVHTTTWASSHPHANPSALFWSCRCTFNSFQTHAATKQDIQLQRRWFASEASSLSDPSRLEKVWPQRRGRHVCGRFPELQSDPRTRGAPVKLQSGVQSLPHRRHAHLTNTAAVGCQACAETCVDGVLG